MAPMRTASIRSVQLPSGNYTRHDICFGKYFKAVTTFGKKVLHLVFIVMYSTSETAGGCLTVREYCLEKLNWTNTQFRNAFSVQERELLEKNPQEADFTCDVSLLFKLIIKVLDNLAQPIMQELRDLKNLRNMVCHEDVEMDEADMRSRIGALEVLCCKILEGLRSITAEDVSIYVKDMKSGLRDLLEAKIEVSDVQIYLQDVACFRQQKHSKLIIEGRKEFVLVYREVKILNPCSWLSDNKFNEFHVDRIFTTLVIVNGGARIMMNEILNITMLNTRFVPRMVIVSGVMGVGKTSLHRYILHEWCRSSPNIIGLSSMDIVIGIELRMVSCGSLVQLLREQLLKSTSRLFHESDIIPLLQDMNVLFCIDGMDEAGAHGRTLVREILNKFTNCRIIITTRPEFTLELMHMADEHILLNIDGFDDQGKMTFVNNVFTSKYTDKQKRHSETVRFLDFMSTTCQRISSHLTLPLSLSLLLVVWCDDTVDINSISTLTHLYHKIYDLCQRKLVSRLEAAGAGHEVSLSRKVSRWFVELGHVAWDMMCKDEVYITEEQSKHLMNMCDVENIDPIQTMSAFLNCEIEETLTETKYIFSFHHFSAQEFLGAVYISEEVAAKKSVTSIFEAIDSPKFRQIMMYVSGLLKKNGNLNPTVAKQIKETYVNDMKVLTTDYVAWWKLLREAENDISMSIELKSIVNKTGLWIIKSMDSREEMEAKLDLIRETGVAPSELIMDVHYTTTLNKCNEMQEILRLVGESQNSRVKLYLENEFNSAGYKEVSDPHVIPLLKSNCIVEFKGHVGEDLMSELVGATNVESLFIRVSTLEALHNLKMSIKKYRGIKVIVRPSKRWALRFMELFLDISSDVSPEDIPCLHYSQDFVLKLANVSDKNALWAGKVVSNLNDNYSCVILQSSSLTMSGMKEFLYAVSDNKVKSIRVLSDHPATVDQMQYLAQKYRVRIGWGSS